MKKKFIVLGVLFATFGFTKMNAQINFGDKAIGAVQKGVTGFTFNHLGFPVGIFSMTVSIYQNSKYKDNECSLFDDSFKI